MLQSQAGEASSTATLSPEQCSVSMVTMVPFLTGRWDETAESPSGVDTTPDRGAPAGLCPAHDAWSGGIDGLSDLHLWGYSAAVNAELRAAIPHRLRRTTLPPKDLVTTRGDVTTAWRGQSSYVDLWSTGVGLACEVYRLDVGASTSWADIRSSFAFQSTKEEVLHRADQLVADSFGSDTELPRLGETSQFARPGQPLWVQEMLIVESRSPAPKPALDDVARQLTDDGQPLEPQRRSSSVAVRLGREACVAVPPGSADLVDSLGRVVATQTAVWAAAIDLHFLLERMLRQGGGEARRLPIGQLEQRSLNVLNVFERVQRFRVSVEILPLHLGAADKAAWGCVEEAWGLGNQLSALDSMLEAVGHVYQHLTDTMSARLARFLNIVVMGVTCLSLGTFWLTIWEFTQKRFDPFDRTSGIVALVAALTSAALFVAVWFLSSHTATARKSGDPRDIDAHVSPAGRAARRSRPGPGRRR